MFCKIQIFSHITANHAPKKANQSSSVPKTNRASHLDALPDGYTISCVPILSVD